MKEVTKSELRGNNEAKLVQAMDDIDPDCGPTTTIVKKIVVVAIFGHWPSRIRSVHAQISARAKAEWVFGKNWMGYGQHWVEILQ